MLQIMKSLEINQNVHLEKINKDQKFDCSQVNLVPSLFILHCLLLYSPCLNLYLWESIFQLTSGNPNSSVAPVTDNHFFGSDRIESRHPETTKKKKNIQHMKNHFDTIIIIFFSNYIFQINNEIFSKHKTYYIEHYNWLSRAFSMHLFNGNELILIKFWYVDASHQISVFYLSFLLTMLIFNIFGWNEQNSKNIKNKFEKKTLLLIQSILVTFVITNCLLIEVHTISTNVKQYNKFTNVNINKCTNTNMDRRWKEDAERTQHTNESKYFFLCIGSLCICWNWLVLWISRSWFSLSNRGYLCTISLVKYFVKNITWFVHSLILRFN